MAEWRSGTRSPGVNLLGLGLGQGLDESFQGTAHAEGQGEGWWQPRSTGDATRTLA